MSKEIVPSHGNDLKIPMPDNYRDAETMTKQTKYISEFHQKLATIQRTLKAPKGQFNAFGKYKYRNCEDILEAVKPLLGDMVLTIEDDIKEVAGRIYIKATATIGNGQDIISVSAFAREPAVRKGMDEAQVTGASSSYARKYALNGLFCIDDNKDPDTQPKPEKKDYSKINGLIDNIKSLSGKLCAEKDMAEKIKFMNSVLKVQNFDHLKNKPFAELEMIYNNLLDINN